MKQSDFDWKGWFLNYLQILSQAKSLADNQQSVKNAEINSEFFTHIASKGFMKKHYIYIFQYVVFIGTLVAC